MERRPVDLSKLAELSTVALLSGRMRLALQEAQSDAGVGETASLYMQRGARYLDTVLEGLQQLTRGQAFFSPAAPDQMNAIDSCVIAASALSPVGQIPSADELRELLAVLEGFRHTVDRVLKRETVSPSELKGMDGFFESLARYACEEYDGMVSAPMFGA